MTTVHGKTKHTPT